MKWKNPHINKVYEAITAIKDKRIIQDPDNPNKAKCYSSSGNKYYEVELDPISMAMMSNDNSAYYTDSLSYPMIALLMMNNKLNYSEFLGDTLGGIFWKDINQQYKNDYDKSVRHVLDGLLEKGIDIKKVQNEIQAIYDEVLKLEIDMLGEKKIPPKAY